MNDIESLKKFVRAANYLSVTQIYLQDNFLLRRDLEYKDIKKKLFGHWGTCPGINFVYANVNYLVKKSKQSTIFVLGPGHGFPALQANLFMEGTLAKYYKDATVDAKGIGYVSKMFSWPYGFSSHSNPEAPGLILEGGELGYSLATAYGAILDNPDLLAVCMIGDGEAETGPINTAWHINKLIDPAINGAVLPILHVNGYKISGPTYYGRMSDEELTHLFTGFGYEPFFVRGENIYEDMAQVMDTCLKKIHDIQKNARNGEYLKPRFPMIILQTPKGWTGPKEIDEEQIEGSIKAHQVVAPNARKDTEERVVIQKWLESYHFEELFNEKGFSKDIQNILPPESLRIGNNPHVYSKKIYKNLKLPDIKKYAKEVKSPGLLGSNSMRTAGEYLRDVFKENTKEKNFRLFSPDETYSNRLDSVFQATSRAWVWPQDENDKHMSRDGRVMEMLSEHNLHGLTQGYVLTGRHAIFTTYEAFAQIFSSMTHQYEKFLSVARNISWRGDMASLNFMLSSVLWRQEHNGFTHQNPSFVSGMLEKHDCNIQAYYPIDDNSMLVTLKECLQSQKQINMITAGKTVEPRWLSLQQAEEALEKGGVVLDFASQKDADIIMVGIGDYTTKEAAAAIELLHYTVPEIRVKFVNILRLRGKCSCPDKKHAQIDNVEQFFGESVPVIINFHGYPETIESMLLHVQNPSRFSVHGYIEQGGTTTAFDMMTRNKTDRYHLAQDIVGKMRVAGKISEEKATALMQQYEESLERHKAYIIEYGADPIEFDEWHWDERNYKMDDKVQLNLLQNAKTIALVGLSDDPDRYSNKVGEYLQSQGMRIVPVNPKIDSALGEKSYASLLDIPDSEKVDIVAIYRRSEEVMQPVKDAIQKGIKTIWFAEGVRNSEVENYAKEKGVTIVSDFCIMKVHQKLQAKG
ncbi:MAG TPA: phosphoketolase [Candidatus Eisenbacteria bacterium]|nr:phosphoketolase [Candidatus Eisenbacteria bacterium]